MCKFLAPTGAPSKLFDTAARLYGSEYAVKAFAIANTAEFKEWYGNGQRNELGEPNLVQGKFISGTGEERLVEGRSLLEDSIKLAESLEAVFKQFANIEVVADQTIDEHGFTINTGDKVLVKFNPRTVKRETIFHEFGHIYVDLLGEDHPLIQNGIEELRDSELWNKVQRLYPELSDIALGKEVLTTAIGITAAKNIDPLVQYIGSRNTFTDKILFIINRIITEVANLLGVHRNIAERLAYDLTGGKLRNRVTGKYVVSKYKQAQKNPIKELIKDKERLVLSADQKNYVIKGTKTKLERVTNFVELLAGEFDRLAAIQAVAASNKPLHESYETPDQVARLWADKREEGTGIHGIAETYIEGRNNGISRDKIKEVILKVPHKPDNPGDLDEDGVRIYSGMNSDQVSNYLDTIFDFVDSLYKSGNKLYSEVKVFDEELGVAGTIDLLVEHSDGTVSIYDFKTKELVIKDGTEYTQFDEFNAASGKFMKGILGDIPNNANGKYSTQLSFYKAILNRKGIEVKTMRIVPLVGEIEERDGQYNYKNLKLYSTVASNFKDGTFELQDFSQRIIDATVGKDPVETKIEKAVEAQEIQERLSTDTKHLMQIREWLSDVIVDLRKSVARFTQTADPDRGQKYKEAVEELIQRIAVTDEVEAVTNYTKYIVKTLYALHKKLHGQVGVTRRDNGIVEEVTFLEGYAQMTWQDIKDMEDSDYDAFMEFHAFLINAEHFLSQIVKIKNIPLSKLIEVANLSDEDKALLNAEALTFARKFEDASGNTERINLYFKFVEKIGGQLGDAIGILKGYEGLISDLEITIKRLNKELDHRYVELSSNPLYNGDLSVAADMFFKAQLDETFMQRYADALADTHHAYIANVIKLYDHTMHDYKTELRTLLEEFNDKTKDIDLTRLVDDNGKFVLEIDRDKYETNMTAMYEYANVTFGNGTPGYKKHIKNWFTTNVVPLSPSEKAKLIEQKQKSMSKEDYKKWYNNQHYFSTDKSMMYPRTDRAFYKPNPAIYYNPKYAQLTQTERDTVAYLINLVKYVADHTKLKFFDHGYIPAVPANQKSAMQQIKDNIGWRDTHRQSDIATVDSDGEVVNFLTFKFASLLNQQPKEEIPSNLSATAKREAYNRNREIERQNKEAHAAAIVNDLRIVIPMFLDQGLKHKYKKSIEFEIQRVRKSLAENHKIIVLNNGKPIIDRFKRDAGLSNQRVEKSAENSKIMEHYKDWIKMIFYEEFESDEGAWTKIARVLQNYTSFRGMAVNPLSAVNNQVYGALMSRIEAWSGEYFSRKDWYEGSMIYNKSLTSFFSDRDSTTDFSSKASAFLNQFDVLMDTRELVDNPNVSEDTSAVMVNRLSKILGAGYLLNNISEHNLQARLLFAMAKSHKIVNGQIISYAEFVNSKTKKFEPLDMSPEEATIITEENNQNKKNAEAEWQTYTSVWNAYDFVDGRLQLKDGLSIDKRVLADFERRVLGVNQYIHGIYNKADAGAMQKYALGRLAIQFRKWMRPGWNKRWGSRAFEEFYNERRRSTDAGIYVTTMKFLFKPIYREVSNFEQKEYREQTSTLQAVGHIINDYGKMITNLKVHWHSLSNGEKAAIIRTMLEWASLATAVAMLYMLKYIKEDDDDPPLALMLALYQVDRTATELTAYVPMAAVPGFAGGGWMNETKKLLKSPTATFSTIENLFEFSKNLIMYPFVDEETRTYKGGVYNGEDKLKISFIKLVPIWNQINRVDNLDKNYKYYKMF